MKQVRETAAGQKISAWVVLKDGKQVAQVQAHYGNAVQVDIWAAPEWNLQQGRARGYGYDRLTAAMSGMRIDGIEIYNHSVFDKVLTDILDQYKAGKLDEQTFRRELSKVGAQCANWENGRWKDAFYISGLQRLKEMGYTVIKAI